MTLRTITPSSSYQLSLPASVQERTDGRVSNFWLNGEPLLLQTSSYIREAGSQVSAQARLSDRISKHPEQWCIWQERLHDDPRLDQAIGEFVDKSGVLWIHAYFVWPHLTVYATVSGPTEQVRERSNWALTGLRGLALVVQ